MEEANPGGWALQSGQNFSVNHAPVDIDFAAIHVWPDNWERCGFASYNHQPAGVMQGQLSCSRKPVCVERDMGSQFDGRCRCQGLRVAACSDSRLHAPHNALAASLASA